MTVQNLYTQYLDGKITKQKFLYEVRRDQNLTMISPSNSFDDVVKILKNKSIISEKASKESKQPTGKQDVEIIAKTIDMVNPYEYANGMDYELGIIDIPAPDGDLDEDNVLRAQKKVLANLTKNPSYYTEKLYGRVKFDGDETVEINKKSIDALSKGKKNIIREEVDTESEFDVIRGGRVIARNVKFFPNGKDYRVGNKVDTLGPNDSTQLSKMGGVTDMINHIKSQGGLKESYKPFDINEDQEAVFQKYAEATGISIDNLKNMVAEARAKKLADKDYDRDNKLESPEEEYKGSVDRAIKGVKEHGQYYDRVSKVMGDSSPINELGRRTSVKDLFKALDNEKFSKEQINDIDFLVDKIDDIMDKMFHDVADNPKELAIRYQKQSNNSSPINEECDDCERKMGDDLDLGHQDNEPRMIKGELYQIAKQAIELYKMIDSVDNMGEVDFPHWWQAKIVLAKNYLQGSKDYLDSALAIGNEEEEIEETTYAGKDTEDDMKKDKKFNTLSSTGKIDAINTVKQGGAVKIG
jgi:hypothetical protein